MIYDRIEYDVLNRVYRQYVPNAPPARTVMSVQIEAGFKVMLDVIAAAERRDGVEIDAVPAGDRAWGPGARRIAEKSPSDVVCRSGRRLRICFGHDGDRSGDRRPVARHRGRRDAADPDQHGEVLEDAGSSLDKVVKVNVLIYSMLEYENMNSVYREFFSADPPARTVCGVELIGGHKVEIECVALA